MKKLILLLSLLVITSAYACPELDGVDLADGDGPWSYVELSSKPIRLPKNVFQSIPGFEEEAYYEQCKDAIFAKDVMDKKTKKVFTAIITMKDECDGGNSYGALFNTDLTKMLGTINDSYIGCF